MNQSPTGTVRPRIAIIAAMAHQRVIGHANRLPWHLPEDLKHFKALTLGHPIIMGRKTWESIGRPLPGRRSIVVSRRGGYVAPGAELVASVDAALALAAGDAPPAFVIGGAELYRHTLEAADTLYLTEIDATFPGDTYFPAVPARQWRETARESATSASGFGFSFVTYERVAPARQATQSMK